MPKSLFLKKIKGYHCFVRKLSYVCIMNSEQDKNSRKFDPTKSELEILQVLWEYGPSTVRFVNDKLNEQKDVNYTSTLKLMQIMVDKEILKRDESQMKHVYHVIEDEQKTKNHLLNKFVESMYKGSSGNLVMQILGNNTPSKEDLQAIKELLNKLDKDQ